MFHAFEAGKRLGKEGRTGERGHRRGTGFILIMLPLLEGMINLNKALFQEVD